MKRTRQDARPAGRRGPGRARRPEAARGRGRMLGLLLRTLRELAAAGGALALTAPMLAELLRVNRRTCYRLLEALRAAEVPLVRRELEGGGVAYSLRPAAFLRWLSGAGGSVAVEGTRT